MKKEIAELWAGALRSGKYAQGVGCLRRVEHKDNQITSQFCCLGVLCDLYDSTRWGPPSNGQKEGHAISYMYGENLPMGGSSHALPKGIRIWAGISGGRSRGTATLSMENELIQLNDVGRPFEEIAEYIERNWEVI